MKKEDMQQYSKLSEESGLDDSEPFLPNSGRSSPAPQRRRSTLTLIIQAVAVFLSLLVSALLGAYISYRWMLYDDSHVVRKTSRYSHIPNEVEIHYKLQAFNGSLTKPNIYRGPAGPEVDAAWEALGVDYRSIMIPESEAKKSGLSHDMVKINPKYGGGYPAQVEGFHHLHCLNMLRQGLYYNYEHYHKLGKGAFKNDDHILQLHITHCLDILRQQLMCTVDTSIFGQVWVNPERPFPYVDFNAKDHVCKNFEDIRGWVEVHQIAENVSTDFLNPPEEDGYIYPTLP